MRIWSLHPKYLDTKGLVALWRETLLAKHVLEDRTKGYRNHPQLIRFRRSARPLDAINQYLAAVLEEASARGYRFDAKKIDPGFQPVEMVVTTGQMQYETGHLLGKLKIRDQAKYKALYKLEKVDTHPLFTVVKDDVADWEIV